MADASHIEPKIIAYLSSLSTWPMLNSSLTSASKTIETKDADLMNSGVIDSVNIIQLIVFLEKEFGIQIEAHDLVENNFKTIHNMIRFVSKRCGVNDGQ